MKHAYLIIAHNQFDVLRLLLRAIDDERNDIFIHFDKKVEVLPDIAVQRANLHVLKNRVDVRWGDVSMVEAELLLFEAAFRNAAYAYYHLLSGVDMPLKPQNEIHDFFHKNVGKEFIGYFRGETKEDLNRRAQRIHLFPKDFKSKNGFSQLLKQGIRYTFLRIQLLLGIKRNKNIAFKKGTQWVSVTHGFVEYLLKQKNDILKTYRNSFCSDELYKQTVCWNSSFRENIYDALDEGRGCMRHIGWKNNQLAEFTMADLDKLKQSEAMFGRKFSSKQAEVAEAVASI